MKRVARFLAVWLAAASTSAATETSSAGKYPNYYAARDAAERGDCKAMVTHLDAFLRTHPYVPQKYPDFYFELKYVRQQCSEGVIVRGIEGESDAIDPLPEDLPMSE